MSQNRSSQLKRVALIATGGTIASLGRTSLDVVHYATNESMMDGDALLNKFREARYLADVVNVPFRTMPSPSVGFKEWRELIGLCTRVASDPKGFDGIVISHGTAVLEETAYFLSLTLKIGIPVVLVGAQRPASGVSSDAGLNLVNAVRLAMSPGVAGLGVLVLLNDEVQAAREVTKTSTARLQAFRTPDFGILGDIDGDDIRFYRKPLRRAYPDTEFNIGPDQPTLPRVDVVYAHADADGVAIDAYVAAGAKGIVAAGFAPGLNTPRQTDALRSAQKNHGTIIVQSCRAGSGRVPQLAASDGFIAADNLTPQKARILLSLALTRSADNREIERMFAEY